MGQRAIVVGAGVIGLSCAVRLAEAGLEVDVLTRDMPPETCSALGGALWMPVGGHPGSRWASWAATTHAVLTDLAAREGTGVRLLRGHLRSARPSDGDSIDLTHPSWTRLLPEAAQALAPSGAGRGHVARPPAARDGTPAPRAAWSLTVPVLDMPTYLGYLTRRLADAGGTLTRLSLSRLPRQGFVVNCSGSAARALATDPAVRPRRGEALTLAGPGPDRWYCTEHAGTGSLSYVVPHGDRVLVGMTATPPAWESASSQEIVGHLLAEAAEAVPDLAGAPVLTHRQAFQGERPVARVELEPRTTSRGGGDAVVHCYGHGDRGVTVAWGCAGEVLALAREHLG